jgi:actin-related protein
MPGGCRINEAVPRGWTQEENSADGVKAEVASEDGLGASLVEVLASRRKDMELDSRFLSWKGGAIAACLEATRELWITAAQWRTHGERHLRERAAFSW